MSLRILSLLPVAASLLLAACDNGPSPLVSQPLRPGADKSAPLVRNLPPPAPRQYEPGIAPENEERGAKVGEVVNGSGGQQAQKAKEAKAQVAAEAERSRARAELAHQQNSDAVLSTQ